MRRRWWLIGGATLLALVAMSAAALFLFYGRIGAWMIETRVLPKLEARLGRPVAIGNIDVRRGQVVLGDVAVRGDGAEKEPLVGIDKVVVEFDFWASLTGTIDVSSVTMHGVRALAIRYKDGTDNVGDVADRLLGRGKAKAKPDPKSRLDSIRPDVIQVADSRVELRDQVTGVTIVADDVAAELLRDGTARALIGSLGAVTRFGPHAKLAKVGVRTDTRDPIGNAVVDIGGGEVSLWTGMALSGISGRVAQGEGPGQLWIDLAGGYGGVEDKLWRAKGWVDPRAQTGHVRLAADRFKLERLSPVLEKSSLVDYRDTMVDAELVVEVTAERVDFEGDVHVVGLNVSHPMLAAEPVRGLDFAGAVAAAYDRTTRTATLTRADVEVSGVRYQLDAKLELPIDGQPIAGPPSIAGTAAIAARTQPRVEARLVIPPVPCQQMLDSIPTGFVPLLAGFKMDGTFATDVHVVIDWANLDATVLDGSVGIHGCKVTEATPRFSASRLRGSFEHKVQISQGVWETLVIGSENDDFVPIHSVSPYLIKSLITTEDGGFYRHRGFITKEFRTALIKDLKAGYFKYGASSITMQMVKNVFLNREKTLSRKFQELFLTWYVETQLEKARIMEIYVNAIEYGPGLYGIGPAARIYFGKHPSELNPVEAAFFSSILPAPKRRYRQFCKDELSTWTQKKIERILALMYKRERIDLMEYQTAMLTPLVFAPGKGALCGGRRHTGG